MKNIPLIINQCRVYRSGTEELLGVASVTAPDINLVTEDIKAFGIGGFKVGVEGHYEPMECAIKFTNINKEIANFNGVVDLTIRAALQSGNRDTAGVVGIEKFKMEIKGQMISQSGGEFAPAAKNEKEVKFALTYFKQEIDGRVINEIDVFNLVAVSNGTDLLTEIRQAL